MAGVFDFQLQWLTAVHTQCAHPTVEKSVRVLCDYYHHLTSEAPAVESELFWRRRADVTRFGYGAPSAEFGAHLPGVPGNFFMAGKK